MRVRSPSTTLLAVRLLRRGYFEGSLREPVLLPHRMRPTKKGDNQQALANKLWPFRNNGSRKSLRKRA